MNNHIDAENKESGLDTENAVLIPLLPQSDFEGMATLARLMAYSRPVIIVGFVPISAGQSLSTGAYAARRLRSNIEPVVQENMRLLPRIRVTDTPWKEIRTIVSEEKIELLLLNYPADLACLDLTASEILSHPPCDVALARGPFPKSISNVIVPLNGGAHAERALDIGLALCRPTEGKVSSLRLDPEEGETDHANREFESVRHMLDQLPEVEQKRASKSNQAESIIEASINNDVIVLGTVQRPTATTDSFGAIPDFILSDAKCGVIAVKACNSALAAHKRSGKLVKKVDRWFAENTFHAAEFNKLDQLVALKEAQGLTVSVALPTLNEAETLGDILHQTTSLLMEEYPLIDELVIIDSNSTDGTRDIAREFGLPVYVHQELLPRYGARAGKGEALWKSLYVTTGDIVLWCDTDIKNFDPRFIYGLAGPLIKYPNLQFVKGFYHRPLTKGGGVNSSGGRVTELTARPLLNMFFPQLGGVIQPLAGEYGGRRDLLEQLAFTSGYGVETSLLIEALEKVGLNSLAQVDLIERIHHNQSLENLSKMAFAVTQTIFRRLAQKELDQANQSMRRLYQASDEMSLLNEELTEADRPPMCTVPEYRERYVRPEQPLVGVKPKNLLRGTLQDPDEIFIVPGKLASKS